MRIPPFFTLILRFGVLLPFLVSTLRAVVIDGNGPNQSIGNAGASNSLAVIAGHPAVAYSVTDWSFALRYTRSTDADGAVWDEPVTVDDLLHPAGVSLLTVNGNPAIGYVNTDLNTVKFARAIDTEGASWSVPVTLNSNPNRPQDFDIKVVDGMPAVCYAAGQNLVFRRATDPNGTAWGAPVVIPQDAVSEPEMEIVEGRPAIVYMGDSNHRTLRFVRALDAGGSTWGMPMDVITEIYHTTDASPSMKIVDGRPAVSFIRNGELRYVRAADAAGAAWKPSLILVPAQTLRADACCSLAVVQGKPAIAFYTGPNSFANDRDLAYIASSDADGATLAAWNLQDVVASAGDTGKAPMLLEVNGNAAATWYDATVQRLFYLRTTGTADGQRWLWEPLVQVAGSSAPIAPGGSVSTNLVIAGTTGSITLEVVNVSSGTELTGVAVSLEGPNAPKFSVSAPPPDSISGGAKAQFTIQYKPATAAMDPVTVHVTGKLAGIQYSFDFTLTGNSGPNLFVELEAGFKMVPDEGSALLPMAAAGEILDTKFYIASTGGGALSVTGITINGPDSSEFSIAVPPSPSVPSGAYEPFILRHAPLTTGYKAITLHVLSDAPGDRNSYDISVKTAPALLDGSFIPDLEFSINTGVRIFALRADESILAVTTSGLLAFHADGRSDTSFFVPPSSGGNIMCIAQQKNGRILLGGDFQRLGGADRPGLARVLPDGTLDPTFAPPIGPGVLCVAVQPDGKVLAGGIFATNGGQEKPALVRLEASNGALDPTFQALPLTAPPGLALLPDGKIIVAAKMDTGSGATAPVARLRSDGSLDDVSFDLPGESLDVNSVAVQADGKVYAAGSFPGFVARFLPDGSRDPSVPNVDTLVTGLALQTDGKCLLWGNFTKLGDVTRPSLARLNANGSLDDFFNAFAAVGVFNAAGVVLRGDGKILIAGRLFAGGADDPFFRLLNDPAVSQLSAPNATTVRWMRGGGAVEVRDVTFDLKPDGASDWTPLGAAHRIANGWELSGIAVPPSGSLRAQAYAGGSVIESIASLGLTSWRMQYFSTADNAGDAADDADPDHDGLTNFMEYAFGLSPVDRASSSLPAFVLNSNAFTAGFPALEGRGNLIYRAEWTEDVSLKNWTAIPDTGEGGTHVFSLPAVEGRAFMRYRITVK